MQQKIVLLGSGELGKELVIALQRLGQYVIAVDSYEHAPAMQVAHEFEVINMLDGDALDAVIKKHKPDYIVPEIEAIRTERFYEYEHQGYTVVPSAKAANFTMNRKAIRDLAAKELGVKTAPYQYASNLEDFKAAVAQIGIPCVVKPLMSSSGKGQSVIKQAEDIETAWNYALEGSRGDLQEVIVEGFIKFYAEITLLTVTQQHGPTLFCAPIGHRQEKGDYRESWQPCVMQEHDILSAQKMAAKVTEALGGYGIWGVEFFLTDEGVYFSELSPRPHDTGMVTMISQDLSEFALHVRAILDLPIPNIVQHGPSASSVILVKGDSNKVSFAGIEKALENPNTQIRLFGKPNVAGERRMGVCLARAASIESARNLANTAAANIKSTL